MYIGEAAKNHAFFKKSTKEFTSYILPITPKNNYLLIQALGTCQNPKGRREGEGGVHTEESLSTAWIN